MEMPMDENRENDQNLMNRSKESADESQDNKVVNKLIDSDSDGDDIVLSKKSNKKINLLDSDDESNTGKEQTTEISDSYELDVDIEHSAENQKPRKRLAIVDSDSDNEETEPPIPHNNSFGHTAKKEAPIYDFNAKGEAVIESVSDDLIKKRLSVLCDSDSSADEGDNNHEPVNLPLQKSTHQKSNRKSGVKKQKEEKPKSMTGKDVLELRKEIRSESQRMTREMNVTLPYHKPKPRTLQEFLQKRPRFAAAVPLNTTNTPPSVALKMSTKELEIVSQKLSEREKQVEEFFKSESESEEESSPPVEQTEKTDKDVNEATNKTETENNQKNPNDEKLDLVEAPENEPLAKGADNTAVTMIDDIVVTTDAINAEKPSDGNAIEAKSVVVLQNILLNPKSQDFDSGILEDLPSTNDTISTSGDGKDVQSGDDTIVHPSSEKSELDLLMEKYNVCNSAEPSTSIELNVTKKPSILELVKEKVGDAKPHLSGNSDDIIIFDENINKLQERFIKHTTKKLHHKHNVQLNVVSFANGEIQHEKLAVSVDEDDIPILEKPGERLKQLKSDLEIQMAEKRSKYWQEKLNNKKDDNSRESGNGKDIDDSDVEKDILDIADEEEFTEIEDDEDEDVLDENADEEEGEEEKTKCAFGDDEAIESDADDKEENMEVDEDDEVQDDVVEEEENSMDADDEDEPLTDAAKKKKKLKRIVKPFENDSDDEQPTTPVLENKLVNRTKSTDALFDTTDTLEELSGPTPHQRQDQRTPTKRTTTLTRSDLGFLTPVIQLTGLQSLNSGSKFLHDSPVSPFRMPQSPSEATHNGPQKKLFEDSQTLDDDIEDLCSGKFTTQPESVDRSSPSSTNKGSATLFRSEELPEVDQSQAINTQDFLEVCSGKFTGITQPEKKVDSPSKMTELVPEKSKDSSLLGAYFTASSSKIEEIKSLDDEDDGKLISQLLDEEEMERFKKQFESPEKCSRLQLDEEELPKVGRVIFDSSDEEEGDVNKKKRRKNLISDDEDDDNQVANDDDNEMVCDDEDEGELNGATVREIEYDSEENEIEVVDASKKKLKASDFFEEEAELSESEWGSADEDEKDLDEFEIEEGDKEKLDEDQVKRDLERIHMRRILDDDNHEVKILQELLLDDGELHGSGRERQFKWRNIDTVGNEENANKEDDDGVYLDDDNEDEEKWRKMRHEREAFLKKQQERSQMLEEEDSIIDTNSHIFKLGQAAIKRSFSNTPNNTVVDKRDHPSSPEIKTSFTLMSKKGSFLTRSEHVLQRVAEFTSKTVNLTIGGPKNSRNFVFQSVDTETKVTGKDLKRKAPEGTPVAIKKLRLDTVSPAVQKKPQNKSDRSKKLFSNW